MPFDSQLHVYHLQDFILRVDLANKPDTAVAIMRSRAYWWGGEEQNNPTNESTLKNTGSFGGKLQAKVSFTVDQVASLLSTDTLF